MSTAKKMAIDVTHQRTVELHPSSVAVRNTSHQAGNSFNSWVALRGVQKTYDGETLVVRNLSLSARKGEFLTLLGPSGSGKTTTLMMLAGFEAPTSGTIHLAGQDLTHLPPHKRGIGVVFQNYALFPHMTVAENVGFPLQIRRLPKPEIVARVERALTMVQLSSLADRRPAQMSGGQQQRTALARALVFEPSLVLMDEPLGALDRQLRESMQIEIKHLHEKLGLTIVYVTHDQDEALTMSDRVAVFSQGIVQQIGPPSELYERPSNAFVAGFIGENNLLTASVVTRDEDGLTLRLTDGGLVRVSAGTLFDTGQLVHLVIRPEKISLGSPGVTVNALSATVREVTYRGDHRRVRASTSGGVEFLVKIPSNSGTGALATGDVIAIGWSAEDGLALPQSMPEESFKSAGSGL